MKFGRQAQSPIDDQLAEADIQDRLQLANTLRQRSMEGASLDNVGGHLIGSPWARALSSAAQGIQGAGERKRAYTMATDLATSKRERLAQALGGAGQDRSPDGMIEFGTRLLNDPATADVGQFYIQAGQKAKERAAAREAEAARWQHQDQTAEDRFNRSEASADRRATAALEQQRQAADARLAAIQARPAAQGQLPAALLQELNYLRQFDASPDDSPETAAMKKARRDEFWAGKRAQQVLDRGGSQDVLQPGAAPGTVAASLPKTLAPNQTPEHAGDVAREKIINETEGKAEVSQQDVQPVLGEIEAIFGGTAEGQKAAPTGSGIGRIADTAGAMFGVSVPGAAEAERLNVLAARLTAKVPRMEGQQSNQDRDYYEMQAGRLGNASLPLETRKEAFREVKRIWQIKSQNPAAPVAPPSMAPPAPAAAAPADYSHLSDEQLLQQLGGQP